MDLLDYIPQFQQLLLNNIPQLSNIRPSDWAEKSIMMGSPFPGRLSYKRTPYTREIIDCFAPDHPARKIAVMKGAQIGLSASVLIPLLCWIIAESPGNTYFTVGAPDLIEKATEKLDLAIDRAGLRGLIKPQVQRKKNQRTGDTNTKKDFMGGYINIGTPNNHAAVRDVSLKYGLFDDWEAARKASKESGDTRLLFEQRFAAYLDVMKIAYISTPEQKNNSNILPAYLLGDQRKFNVHCPHCASAIVWEWSVKNDDGEVIGGITWKVDQHNQIVSKSVGYICQECGNFFDDKRKSEYLNSGIWIPTAVPSEADFYSYHISSLYAPLGMFDWAHYVQNWINMHPMDAPRKENEYKTFVNVVLGMPSEDEATEVKANAIMRNTRQYDVLTIPEELSLADGNGHIVLLTLGSDMNGKEDDARLDWEILAHSETGANYSVAHGSIGTFVPNENAQKFKTDRIKWTYQHDMPNSVWPEFYKLIQATYTTELNREMGINPATLDSGHYTEHAYRAVEYARSIGLNVVAVKGDKEDQMVKYGIDVKLVKPGQQHPNLYILQVGLYKDKLSQYMQLQWDGQANQPANFMNYPQPSDGLYGFQNYFEHYEAEAKRTVKNRDNTTSFRWEKKTTKHQNHMWDCRIYNLAAIDILLIQLTKESKQKVTWSDFLALVLGHKK